MAIRAAEAADSGFLEQMLVAAAFWRVDGPAGSVQQVMGRPELAHYLARWPLPGDLGMIALDDVTGAPIGAAWLRYLRGEDAGYGYLDDATPELSIGVVAGRRGQGVGAQLIEALIDAARPVGIEALSLSVEPDNYALRLYERHGFGVVGGSDGSLTMLRVL